MKSRGLRCLAVLTVVFTCLAVQAVFTLPAYGYAIVGWGEQKTPNASLTNLTKISAGYSHSLALKSDGSIVGWGSGQPPAGNDFIAVAAGNMFSLALKSDGSIVGWGENYYGQATPPAGNNFIAIAAGGYHSLALKSDGSIVGWGDNPYGQATPPAGNNFIAIAAGTYNSLALKSDGRIIDWGFNPYGQPPAGNNFIAIAAGFSHRLALKSDGSIVGWGHNSYGAATPPAGNDFVAIAAGYSYSLALKSDGSIVGWGYNNYGQATPPAGNNFIAIAANSYHSLALRQVVDLNNDHRVDFSDFALFANRWLETDCQASNNWCQGADFDWNGQVDLDDLAELAENWLQGVVVNLPPDVDAGQDQTIILPVNAVNLDGTVTDDGLPNPPAQVTTLWTQQSGAGTVTFGNANAVDTTASFSEAGIYVLRLTADDSKFQSYDEVTITVNPQLPPPADYYVDPNGNDSNPGISPEQAWKTIQKAVDTVQAGNTVLVMPGTYSEQITTVNAGTSGSPIIYRAWYEKGTVLINAAGNAYGFKNTKAYVILDGFEVINANQNGIIFSNDTGDNCIIRNCVSHNNGTNGIKIDSTDNCLIENCLIYNNIADGVEVTGNADTTYFNNCTIYGNSKDGIGWSTSDGTVNNCIIVGNGWWGLSSYGTMTVNVYYSDIWNNVKGHYDNSTKIIEDGQCIHSDPMLTAPSSGDFNLQSDSPCKNTASDGGDIGYRY